MIERRSEKKTGENKQQHAELSLKWLDDRQKYWSRWDSSAVWHSASGLRINLRAEKVAKQIYLFYNVEYGLLLEIVHRKKNIHILSIHIFTHMLWLLIIEFCLLNCLFSFNRLWLVHMGLFHILSYVFFCLAFCFVVFVLLLIRISRHQQQSSRSRLFVRSFSSYGSVISRHRYRRCRCGWSIFVGKWLTVDRRWWTLVWPNISCIRDKQMRLKRPANNAQTDHFQ